MNIHQRLLMTYPVGDNDPQWSQVVALLHLDGTNGSTVFTDQKGHSFTSGAGAALSTTEKKFGSASLLLNGTSQYIQCSTSPDWDMGSGDFTIEMWIRPAATISAIVSFYERWNTYGIGMTATATGKLSAFCQNSAGNVFVSTGATTISASTWHHIAMTRQGTTLRTFLDGVQEGTATFTGMIEPINEPLSIGYDNSGTRYFNGNIDEIRITKGYARYTASFTPPAAPFPNS